MEIREAQVLRFMPDIPFAVKWDGIIIPMRHSLPLLLMKLG